MTKNDLASCRLFSLLFVFSASAVAASPIIIEAENYQTNAVAENASHSWIATTSPGGASDGAAMMASPNVGVNYNKNYDTDSPRLDYSVNFDAAGTYYVWVNGHAGGRSSDDSVHVGVDGVPNTTSDRITLSKTKDWLWSGKTMDGGARATVVIESAGEHQISLWMREDGAIIDQILLVADEAYDPGAGEGEDIPLNLNQPSALIRKSQTENTVTLAWQDNSNGETGFEVYRQVDGGDWGSYKTLSSNVETLVDYQFSAGRTYNYKVAAYNDQDVSSFTDVLTVITDPATTQPIALVARTGHADGDYGIARYGATQLAYDVPEGSGRLLLFGVSYEQNTDGILSKSNFVQEGQVQTDKTISAVSYGGVPLTMLSYVQTVRYEDGHQNHAEMWYMLESDLAKVDGSEWVVDWFEAIDDNDNLRGFSAVYSNVNQALPFADIQEAYTNSGDRDISVNINTADNGYLITQIVAGNAGYTDWSGGVTEVLDLSFSGVMFSNADAATNGQMAAPNAWINSNNLRRAMLAVSLHPSDNDGMADQWEVANGLNPLDASDAAGDMDGDGITNLDEYLNGTNPGQGGDVLPPPPENNDVDNDGMLDVWEIAQGLNPADASDAAGDIDSDNLSNLAEYLAGTDPNQADSDGDALPDGWELNNGLDPLNGSDALQDADSDGISNLGEYLNGSDPNVSDVVAPPPPVDPPIVPGAPLVLVDFGGLATAATPDGNGYLWNNYAKDRTGSSAQVLDDVYGNATAITLQTTTRFAGLSTRYGMTGSTRYPLESVSSDYFWTGSSASDEGVLVFSQLTPSVDYTFVLYGSREDNGSSRNTRYTLTGATVESGDMQVINNLDDVVTLALMADADGKVALSVAAVAPDSRAHLNAIEISVGGGVAPPPPVVNDADNDGMLDSWELAYGLDPLDASDATGDMDSDGITNLDEYLNGTDPTVSDLVEPPPVSDDADNDGMLDVWEIAQGLNPSDASDALGDADGDSLSNLAEYLAGTNPNRADSDSDALPDGWELSNGLDPLNGSDALQDADSDGISNLGEYLDGTDPNVSDVVVPPPPVEPPDVAGAPLVLVDFGGTATPATADGNGYLWNNYAKDRAGSSAQVLNDVYGNAMAITLETTTRFAGLSTRYGMTGSSRFPLESVSSDYFWIGSSASDEGVLVFSQLTPGVEYSFVLYGSREANGSSRNTRYTLTGATVESAEMQVIDNLDDVVSLSLMADASGEIMLSVVAVAPDSRAHLNAIEISVADGVVPVPVNDDADNDGMLDVWEIAQGLNPSDASDATGDNDSDGANNLSEYLAGTDPNQADSDSDALPDGWELNNGLDPLNGGDALQDADDDGISNLGEYLNGTDPNVSDLLEPPPPVEPPGESDAPLMLIDFGGIVTAETPDDNGYLWNHYADDRASSSAQVLNDVYGNATAIALETTTRFAGLSTQYGMTGSTRFPLDSVSGDYFWTGSSASGEGILVFSQLNPGTEYTFVLYGSRVDDGRDRDTRYTLTGATVEQGDLQVSNNLDETVVLTLMPDSNGDVILSVTSVSPNARAHLNAIELIVR